MTPAEMDKLIAAKTEAHSAKLWSHVANDKQDERVKTCVRTTKLAYEKGARDFLEIGRLIGMKAWAVQKSQRDWAEAQLQRLAGKGE